MEHLLFLALTVVLPCAAQPVQPKELTPAVQIATIPDKDATFSPDFKIAASAGEESINVWSVKNGRQLHRIPLPKYTRMGSGDHVEQWVPAISPDDKSLVLLLRNNDWSSKGYVSFYLVTLDDEKVKPLLTRRGGCRHGFGIGIWFCPNGSAIFSPDGSRLALWTNGPSGSLSQRDPFTRDYQLAVLDHDGKTLEEHRETTVQAPDVDDKSQPEISDAPIGIARAPGFGRDGALLGVVQDDDGCEVRNISTAKRVSFLDDCSRKDIIDFIDLDHAFSWHWESYDKGSAVKRWSFQSGQLEFKKETGDFNFATAQDDGRLFRLDKDHKRLKVYDPARGPGSYATIEAPIDDSYPIHVSRDASLVAVPKDGKLAICSTGLTSTGAVARKPLPPAEPVVDVDAVPAALGKTDPDAFAVVIGIEKYRQDGITAVDYASRDANTMYAYLTDAMGFDPKNVVLLTDAHATKADFEKNLGSWLKNRVDAKSRVFVYYAGHGSPNPATGEGYLMPYEADPNYLVDTAYPVAKLYAALGKLPTKDVTVVLDACFSGQGGRSLIAKGARPLVTVAQAKPSANAVVLAAAQSNQISASNPDRRHGLLTSYLLEALQGAADARGDGKITADEIYAYVRPAVERAARLQNLEQTPTLSGTPSSRPWIVLAPKKP